MWDLAAALDPRSPAGTLCLRTLIEHTGRVFRLQFDDFQIVSSSHDDTILIWDFLSPDSPSPKPILPKVNIVAPPKLTGPFGANRFCARTDTSLPPSSLTLTAVGPGPSSADLCQEVDEEEEEDFDAKTEP